MDTKNINIDILSFLEINPPLKVSPLLDKKDKINILLDDKILFEIKLNDEEAFLFNIQFFNPFKIITPIINELKNNYSINYSTVPLITDDIEDFRYIIIEIEKHHVVLNINFSHDYSFMPDFKKNNNFILKFTKNQKFKINFNIYEELKNFYSDLKAFDSLLHTWIYGLGIMLDFKNKLPKDILFANIKEELNIKNIFIILKNWEDDNVLLKAKKECINNLETLIQKLLLNDINFILQFDNTIPINTADKYSVMHMRNGKYATSTNRVSIDCFNPQGQLSLIDIYRKIFFMKSSGIYLYPLYSFFTDKNIYEKTICKNENILLPYFRNVQKGIKIIDAIIKKTKTDDKIYFTNVLSKNTSSGIFLKYSDEDINEIIEKIEDYYRQGFINFGLYVTHLNFNVLSKTSIKKIILLLIPQIMIFDIEFILDLINSDSYFKEQFLKIINLRNTLRSLFDNIIFDFLNYGVLPLTIYKINNDISGFFLGDYLYCSLIKERLLDSIVSVPEGKWYSWIDSIIVYGLGNYSQKHDKEFYHLFQREGTIVHYINDNNNLYPNKIKFVIFPLKKNNENDKSYTFDNIKKTILERIKSNKNYSTINHDIKLLFNKKNKIILKYSSKNNENVNRSIMFHVVTEEIKINNIVSNEKKIFFHQDNSAFIEFELINKTNNFNIEISYS